MPSHEHGKFARPDPEALLKHVQAAERSAARGPLKIFLGYASGVGNVRVFPH
jgi:K+-sensing histidine kinase KdpD